jgi:hypothetical protein
MPPIAHAFRYRFIVAAKYVEDAANMKEKAKVNRLLNRRN